MDVERATSTAVFWMPHSFFGGGGRPGGWRTYDYDPPVVTTAGEAREKGCSVCMEAFEEDDRLRRMECSHAFHEDCISMWLGVSHLCPLCRFALRTQGRGRRGA
ncbi:hypothetical protein VPH35_081355 [Triticum aestivum]